MQTQAKIIMGYQCNNCCVFCYDRAHRFFPRKTLEELKKEVRKAFSMGYRTIHFIGGEPTLYQELFELITFAKQAGFTYVMITTNARMLAYPGFARQLVSCGISQVVLSIHGHNAKLHDHLTGSPGSFQQAMQAVKNLQGCGFYGIGSNSIIVKESVASLPKTAKLLNKMAINRAEFIWVGTDQRRFKVLSPRVKPSAVFIREVLEYARGKKAAWIIQNLPLRCYAKGYFEFLSSAGGEGNCIALDSQKSIRYQKADMEKKITWVKVKSCKGCSQSDNCSGIWDLYLKCFGTDEIKPIT